MIYSNNKRFNTTGVCISKKHYMVDISNKLKQIKEYIDNEFYFTINKPRQYGKTTTLNELSNLLRKEYLIIDISFEGIGDKVFESEEAFCKVFIELMSESIEFRYMEESRELLSLKEKVENIKGLSKAITKFIKGSHKDVILIIDEVDKSTNNQLFLSFIGMLRNKYLAREMGKDFTFRSVILAGLHDVKSLKLKIRNQEETKYNSPWNIAVDFNVDMSFSSEEIATMLLEYSRENNLNMDIIALSEELYFFTEGYPFLVTRICQIIDEKIYKLSRTPWNIDDIRKSIKIILEERNTLFDSMIKNIENNNELYTYIEDIIVRGVEKSFNNDNPLIDLGIIYGYFKNEDGKVRVANRIFRERIYNYMISKLENKYNKMDTYNFKNAFIQKDGGLNIQKVLKRFKQFMKEQYSTKDSKFIEYHGRLLFLAFIKPIINGTGFDFKEVQVSEEKRLDVVITYNRFKYIIEMKIWRGPKYHDQGIKQLCDYLDIHDLDKGYLLVFNFNNNKEYKEERISVNGKEIFEVYV